ncbi:MAG: arachidonate 15-lipoxygenase [Myxococcota bacterium]|jgi:arachidonate 15-lipoxygenase
MSRVRPTLPQDDPNPKGRERLLTKARNTWRYNFETLPPLASTDGLPDEDKVSAKWTARAGVVAARVGLNSVKVRAAFADSGGLEAAEEEPEAIRVDRSKHESMLEAAEDMLEAHTGGGGLESAGTPPDADELQGDVEQRINEILGGGLHVTETEPEGLEGLREFIDGPNGRPSSPDEYTKLFQAVPVPLVAASWSDDKVFTWERIAGPNARYIQGVSTLPENFPLGTDTYAKVMVDPDDSLTLAGGEGRLFISDYALVSEVLKPSNTDGVKKYISGAIALFAVPRGGGELRPVGIQCAQTPSADNPILTPLDGDAWQLAKGVMQVADANYHEIITHLARTHLFTEVSLLATRRYLCADRHPIWLLLVPHYEGTVFMNYSARGSLIAPGGAIDRIFAGEIYSSQALAVAGLKNYDFKAHVFPRLMKSRKNTAITNYPYRDDATLIWEAIHSWVTSYVNLYYADDAAVTADSELQAWAGKLQEPLEAGGLPGFPEITTRKGLAEALSHIIFVPSAQHAAVNFPQRTDMTWPPLYSGAGWRPAPGTESIDDADRLDFMPPLELADAQVQVLELLGGVYHTPLGTYESNSFSLLAGGYPQWFEDPRVTGDLLPRFTAALKGIETTINGRNPGRLFPYEHLLPSRIPMSINI